ncbi:MAG: OmpA family protein [Litoreibacter sp.]|nr:OmpA family protein [Litoreibacter sp.]
MKTWLAAFLLAACTAPAAMAAVELSFPGPARETFNKAEDFTSYKMPVGPFAEGAIQTVVAEGPLSRIAWRVAVVDVSTLAVMDSLRQQVESIGFELLYECETRECGGFDFRFQTDVLPEPVMHIDLGDFRFLSAQRLGGAIPEYLSLFVSRSEDFAYVQLIIVGGGTDGSVSVVSQIEDVPVLSTAGSLRNGGVAQNLEEFGRVVLEDLIFATGEVSLLASEYESLRELSDYLKEDPARRVTLVGHTDAVGSLEANIELSRQRAKAVLDGLVTGFGVSEEQVAFEGIGYLAPRAGNQTEAGRTANRRVEVVLTSTQ